MLDQLDQAHQDMKRPAAHLELARQNDLLTAAYSVDGKYRIDPLAMIDSS